MFGYACNENAEFMPSPIYYAHLLAKRLAEVRKNKKLDFLRPDGKSQVTFEYEAGKPKRVDTIVISTQHSEEVTHKQIEEGIRSEVISHVFKNVAPIS